MKTQQPSRTPDRETLFASMKAVLRFAIMTVIMLSVLFIAAGQFNWWEAWTYVAMTLFILIFSRFIIILKYPDMALERAEAPRKENVKTWDVILVPIITIYGPLISWIIAGLDERFGWSPDLADPIQILAFLVMTWGSLFGSWAMIVNRFFSSHVRIQEERGHIVVSTGPYRLVRHPGYLGGIVGWIAAPIFFSSYWVVIPAILVIIAILWRTDLEDRTLREELTGYQDYADRVRYRLIPGIW